MNESYNPGSDHEQRDVPEPSPTTNHQQSDTSEGRTPGDAPVTAQAINNGAGVELTREQNERLVQAGQIVSGWMLSLRHETYDPAMSALVDRIIELSADYPTDFSKIRTEDLDFKPRTLQYLNFVGIRTVGDLLPLSYQKLSTIGGVDVGVRRTEEIRAKLGTIGVTIPDK